MHRDTESQLDLIPLLAEAVEETLAPRLARVFELRFGIADGQGRSLTDVGAEVGVSRERVRQYVDRGVRGLLRGASAGKLGATYLLVDRICSAVRAGDPGVTGRCVGVAQRELPHLPLNIAAWLLLSLSGVTGFRRTHLVKGAASHVRIEKRVRAHAEASRRREQRFLELVGSAFWPRHALDPDAPVLSAARRRGNGGGERSVGEFASEKLGRLVEYESNLERAFLLQAETLSSVIAYQEQPLAIEYAWAGTPRIYYPDVLVQLEDGRVVVAELKPRFQMALRENLAKWRAAILYCRPRGWGFLVTDGSCSLRRYLELPVDEDFAQRVISAAQSNGGLDWPAYKRIRDDGSVTTDDFLALVLQKRLEWSLSPFRLAAPRNGAAR